MYAYDEVVDELRAEFARQKISQDKVARRLGHNQQWLSRRLRGEVPFYLPDFYDICQIVGLEPDEVIRYAEERHRQSRQSRQLLPRRDSNLQPSVNVTAA